MNDNAFILIPAKGHSNRVPGKNLREVGGKSLLAWAIERAVDSGIGDVVVSTDSAIVANVCLPSKGVHVLRRPLDLADGRVTQVCRHAILSAERFGIHFLDTLILTLPTSPLITYRDLQLAYKQFLDGNRRTLFCVTKVEEADTYLLTKRENGLLSKYYPYEIPQKVPAYVDVGGMIIMDIKKFLEVGDYYNMSPWQGYEVGKLRAIDVDTELDLLWADFLLKEVLPYDEG